MNWNLIWCLRWDIIDVLINFLELLVICLPATVLFMYYRVKSVRIWAIDKSYDGAKFLIHNETNRSIFITNMCVTPLKNNGFEKATISYDKKVIQLKPDEYIETVINYKTHSNTRIAFMFTIQYDWKKQKKIKVITK